MVCLNTNNPEVAKLMKATKVGLLELTIRYNDWLKDNPGESRMPSPTELGIAGIKQNKSELVKSSLVPVVMDRYGVTISNGRYNYNNNTYNIDQILKATLGITINSNGYVSVNAKVFMENNPEFKQAAMNSNPSLSETAIMNMFSSFLAQSNNYAIAITDVDGFVQYINETLQRSPTIDRAYIDLEERLSGFKNKDGSNKTYSSYDEALEIADEYNESSKELQAFVVRVFDDNDNTLYGIRLEENVARTSVQVPDWFVIDESEITYTDDDGNLCAANGLSNTVSGTRWKMVKDFKGKPKHSQGGYDITIKDNGFYIGNIKAKNGLVLPAKKPTQHLSNPNFNESLPSYFKGSKANPIQLDEVTVTAEAPEWLKHRREYVKNNPFSIDKYVENRFNNPVGREAIEKIDAEGWKKKLRREGLEKRYNSAMDYVAEQLVKNKPQGKLSRAEWLNTMSDKEEEFIKRIPRYQSSLWADTRRGLTSLVEQNPLQTFQNILNSSDYSNREKQEMLQDYIDHPIMSKLGDAAKILNPLTVPSKIVQSAYKDDYSFTDALKGKKNNAGIVEDIITDPLNLVGAGLVGKLSKADKVIDATKAGSKVSNKTDDVIFTERKNMEIMKKGNQYFKELDNPESLKRLKEFGDEYGIDLVAAYKKAEERWDYGTNIGKNERFQVAGEEVFKDDIVDAMGVSKIKKEDLVQKFLYKDKKIKEDLSEGSINYINKKASIEDYNTIVWHELSHDINKNIIGSSQKLQDDISNIFVKNLEEVDKTKALKAKEVSNRLYKSDFKRSDKTIEDTIKDELDYVSKPTETWAFLSTNLRQDLKNTGVIKNYNELLTPEKLEQAIKNGNTVFSRFEPYIKDKDAFIKLFNKMTLSIAPAVLYLQSQQNNKTEE